MQSNKEKLNKFIDFIEELSLQKSNAWFKNELISRLGGSSSKEIPAEAINEIHELCIKRIIQEHAEKFYSDFKLSDIKCQLISDFIRMETFRRNDNFEDFCLAMFQQIESIVNALVSEENKCIIIRDQFTVVFSANIENSELESAPSYEGKMLWQIIFHPDSSSKQLRNAMSKLMIEWSFDQRFKSIIYFYYCKNKFNHNIFKFNSVLFIGLELYRVRNSNHRGGDFRPGQKEKLEKLIDNQYKNYLKFLGFLEDFTSTINQNI